MGTAIIAGIHGVDAAANLRLHKRLCCSDATAARTHNQYILNYCQLGSACWVRQPPSNKSTS
jgi:hypothetical protein